MEQVKEEIKIAAAEAVKIVSEAAKAALEVVSKASHEATKVLATADTRAHREDHDILVTLVEKVVSIKEDIKDMRNDHEVRLRKVEAKVTRIMTFGTAALIILGIVEFLINQYAHTK